MTTRVYTNNTVATALALAMTNAQATMVLPEDASDYGWPTTTIGFGIPFGVAIDYGNGNQEMVDVTSKGALSGSNRTWNITRGVDGTTAVAHSAGASVRHVGMARDFTEPNTHLNNDGSVIGSGVHDGIARGPINSTNRYGLLSTPTNGAETDMGFFGATCPIISGRLYKLEWHGNISRSDSASDLAVVRFRIGAGLTTGFQLAPQFNCTLPASIVGSEFVCESYFMGAASNATTSTTNVFYTVAAGNQQFTVTLQKNSGSGNSATMGVSNAHFVLWDCGTIV